MELKGDRRDKYRRLRSKAAMRSTTPTGGEMGLPGADLPEEHFNEWHSSSEDMLAWAVNKTGSEQTEKNKLLEERERPSAFVTLPNKDQDKTGGPVTAQPKANTSSSRTGSFKREKPVIANNDSVFLPASKTQETHLRGNYSGDTSNDSDDSCHSNRPHLPKKNRSSEGVTRNRTHTQPNVETERKREAFIELLTKRFPQYADKISGSLSEEEYTVKKPRSQRSRENRRKTTVVTYNANQDSVGFDDVGAMSETDIPSSSFQRGGHYRSSLPVRSLSSNFGREIGLVFLIFKDETKKALLPNEITHLDTVHALFVTAFPQQLSMQTFHSPKFKIYILDKKQKVYYELEDLLDIQDGTVLRIHESDSSSNPQKVKERPPEVRGRTIQRDAPPHGRSHSLRGDELQIHFDEAKNNPLYAVPSTSRSAQPIEQRKYQTRERARPRSKTPDPQTNRPKNLTIPTDKKGEERRHQSLERQLTPDRQQMLGAIPEDRRLRNGRYQVGETANYQFYVPNPTYQALPLHVQTGHHPEQHATPFSPSGNSDYEYVYVQPSSGAAPQTYVAKSGRAHSGAQSQRAVAPAPRGTRHSMAHPPVQDPHMRPPHDSRPQRSQSYRTSPERDGMGYRSRSVTPSTLAPEHGENYSRMDKMEAQLSALTAWVHNINTTPSRPGSEASSHHSHAPVSESSGTLESAASKVKKEPIEKKGMSDLSTASTQPALTKEMKENILAIKEKARVLKQDLRNLRRMQQLNTEGLQDLLQDTLRKIKGALALVPGANNLLVRKQRSDLDQYCASFLEDEHKIDKELGDLESSVEELRTDVISRQCRVNLSDVEGMALMLSTITKQLADLKARFPSLQNQMKMIMSGEMEIVVANEKFLKEEPDKMENSLKRCKKLTGTLFTLKRDLRVSLASVQEHRPSQVPNIGASLPTEQDKKAVLQNIQAMVPNHEARLQSLEAADASRERKKKITTQQEALKFGKSLELASKALKPSDSQEDLEKASKDSESSDTGSVVNALAKKEDVDNDMSDEETVDIPQSVTVTVKACTQKGENETSPNREFDHLAIKKNVARANFFKELSPDREVYQVISSTTPSKTTMDYIVRFSPAKNSSSSSKTDVSSSTKTVSSVLPSSYTSSSAGLITVKPMTTSVSAPTSPTNTASVNRARSSSSSIPRPNLSPKQDKKSVVLETYDNVPVLPEKKAKKLPPPPPPRKTSKLPTSSSYSSCSVNSTISPVRTVPSDSKAKDSKPPVPASSTPKPDVPRKPMSRFEKDLAAGVYANMNRPDLQDQRVPPAKIVHEAKEAAREERAGSTDSNSSGSIDASTIISVKSNNVANKPDGQVASTSGGCDASKPTKKPKPPLPERKSSLLSKLKGSKSKENGTVNGGEKGTVVNGDK